MTGSYVYPRLPRGAALVRLDKLVAVNLDPQRASELASLSHPAAAPVATGPPHVPEEIVQHVASSVRNLAQEFGYPAPLARPRVSAFDGPCAKILLSEMQVVPADAGNEGVWAFLTLVVLPDVALWRFPTGAKERLLGMPRNTFRRLWWRAFTLEGANDPEAAEHEPLGEDELVGIFERPSIARSAALARAMTRALRGVPPEQGVPRSEVMRDLAKRIRRLIAYVSVDVLDETTLDRVVARELADALAAMRARP